MSKISALPSADPIAGTEELVIVQAGGNRKVTTAALAPSAVTHDGTPAVGDRLRVKSVNPLVVELDPDAVSSASIDQIVVLTQAEYDALTTKDPATLYVIEG